MGAAVGWDLLGVDRVVASPVPVGGGKIDDCPRRVQRPGPGHGRTAAGHSLAESSIQAELTTPTGAAILATLVDVFGPMPAMTVGRSAVALASGISASSPTCCGCCVGDAVDNGDNDNTATTRGCWRPTSTTSAAS